MAKQNKLVLGHVFKSQQSHWWILIRRASGHNCSDATTLPT